MCARGDVIDTVEAICLRPASDQVRSDPKAVTVWHPPPRHVVHGMICGDSESFDSACQAEFKRMREQRSGEPCVVCGSHSDEKHLYCFFSFKDSTISGGEVVYHGVQNHADWVCKACVSRRRLLRTLVSVVVAVVLLGGVMLAVPEWFSNPHLGDAIIAGAIIGVFLFAIVLIHVARCTRTWCGEFLAARGNRGALRSQGLRVRPGSSLDGVSLMPGAFRPGGR